MPGGTDRLMRARTRMSPRTYFVVIALVALLAGGIPTKVGPVEAQGMHPSVGSSCGPVVCSYGTCGDFSAGGSAAAQAVVRDRRVLRPIQPFARGADVGARQPAAGGSAAHTPGSKTVQIWFLFGWDGSFDTSSGVEKAVNSYYHPIIQALKDQGYDTPVEHVSRFTGNPARTSITLGQFVNDVKGVGVLVLDGHAKSAFLPIEVYKNTPAGRKEADDAFRRYRTDGYSTVDLGGNGPTMSSKRTTLAIGLTPTGIARHLHGAKDALVVLGMCHGTQAADGFVQSGARAAIYWSGQVQGPVFAGDVASLFSHMDGTALAAPSLEDNAHRVLTAARGACSECSEQLGIAQEPAGAGVTLAPSVLTRSPAPAIGVSIGTPFTVGVTFDTVMAHSSGSAEPVAKVEGCGVRPKSSSTAVHWQDDHTISGTYSIQSDGTLTITVHADQATSAGAGIKLNGNNGGGQSYDGARAPNGDDFVWKVLCHAPVVHIVFTGSGTARTERTSDSGSGFVTSSTGTDQVSWTAVFNLDLRNIARSSQPAGYYLQSDTFDPAASSLSGTSSSTNAIVACPTDQCTITPPCSGTFTRSDDPSPDLYVYLPPAADGAVKVVLPPYFVTQNTSGCGPLALRDSCDPLLAGTPGADSTGPLSATITINPKTWKPGSSSAQPVAPINWSCQSSDGRLTDTGSITWSGTVTLSVPKTP